MMEARSKYQMFRNKTLVCLVSIYFQELKLAFDVVPFIINTRISLFEITMTDISEFEREPHTTKAAGYLVVWLTCEESNGNNVKAEILIVLLVLFFE